MSLNLGGKESKRLVIHIGYHKTATTTIQHFLARNSAKLAKSGVLYPATGREDSSHGQLANMLKPENNRIAEGEALWRKLLREMERSRCHTAIVSSECFLESARLPQVLSRLPQPFQLSLVVYLRRQDLWIHSVYNEVVTDPMRRHVGQIKDLREYRNGMLDYDRVIGQWEQLAPSDNIVLRAFEQGQFVDGDICADFIQAAGLPGAGELGLKRVKARKNPSMPPVYIEFLRRCNLIPMLYQDHTRLVTDLRLLAVQDKSVVGVGGSWLSGLDRRALIESFDACNTRLASRYHLPEGRLFSEPWPEADSLATETEVLSAEQQHRIFRGLSKKSRNALEEWSPRVRERQAGEGFLALPREDDVERLRAIVMRQRHELRMLYRKTGLLK